MEKKLKEEIRSNINYETLKVAISEAKGTGICVQGPEGFKKTLMLMDIVGNATNFKNDEIVLLCCKSYEQLQEKQRQLIDTFDYKEKEVPIIGLSKSGSSQKYTSFWTNKEHPNTIYRETKIVLMTQASLSRCLHHWSIKFENRGERVFTKFIKTIFIDEFDCSMGVIPSLQYSWETFTKKNYFSTPHKVTKSEFIKWLKSNYSHYDFKKLEASSEDDFQKFFIAYWLETAKREGTRVVVATSELLPTTLLERIGFASFRLDYSKEKGILKSHKVITASSPIINKFFFDRLNSKNKWGMFGFDTIISDRCKPFDGTEVDVKVINHMTVKGSNALIGNKEILTIVGNVPNQAIDEVVDCLNFFSKDHSEFDFLRVKQLFYRDRICQAVGRCIGFRGMKGNVEKTHLLINSTILNDIAPDIDGLQFYYTIERWDDFFTDDFRKLEESIMEDKRINKDRETLSINHKKEDFQRKIETKLNELFIKDDKCETTYEDIKRIVKNNTIVHHTGEPISPIIVANHFTLKPQRTSRRDGGKIVSFTTIRGLGVI